MSYGIYIVNKEGVIMNITYDKATFDDSYGIAYVSAYSWKETYFGLLPDDYLDGRVDNISNNVSNIKKFLEDYDGIYMVAKDKEKVVGILAYNANDNDEYGHLDALYVLKDYQGLGIGKELFKQAVVGLKRLGYNKMKLECMTGNSTLSFYKKYLGNVVSIIDYKINGVGFVKADVIVFDNLDEVIKILNMDSINSGKRR